MVLLMSAGIGLILIGLAAIGYGIPVKEFSFGNTLIMTGTIAVATGTIMLGLRAAVTELIAALKGHAPVTDALPKPAPAATREPNWSRPVVQMPPRAEPAAAEPPRHDAGRHDLGELSGEPAPMAPPAEPAFNDREMPPWQKDAARERERARQRVMAPEPPPSASPPPAAPLEPAAPATPDNASDAAAAAAAAEAEAEAGRQRRNLLFHSTRRERQRSRSADALGGEQGSLLDDLRRSAFDEAWPEPERARGDQLRRRASESSIAEDRPASAESAAAPTPDATAAPAAEPQPAETSDKPEKVTLLKSGEVDGMAYSLYSDGSMEAQMPEGLMRFASIEELRSYLDQRS